MSSLINRKHVKLFALSQKHASGDPSVLPASEALAIARGLRSPVLGGAPLEVGAPADFLLLRGSDPELSAGDLDAGLVYAAAGSVVDTTVVGRFLIRVTHGCSTSGSSALEASISTNWRYVVAPKTIRVCAEYSRRRCSSSSGPCFPQ